MAGLAGLVGGALSMGAGEYVSVESQADSESADLARERKELATTPEAEHRELAGIYMQRGLSRELAEQVATEMAAHDALAAHARDELGITEQTRAQPVLAAVASTLSFAVGAAVPLALVRADSRCAQLTAVVFVAVAAAAGGARRAGRKAGRCAMAAGGAAGGVLGSGGHGSDRVDRPRCLASGVPL